MLKLMELLRECTHLIDKILAVIITELLRSDNSMHIGLHEFLRYVNARTRGVEAWKGGKEE